MNLQNRRFKTCD